MLERKKTRVNRRGIFNISRIQPSVSMAEKISISKFDIGEIYLEIDFLAALKPSV